MSSRGKSEPIVPKHAGTTPTRCVGTILGLCWWQRSYFSMSNTGFYIRYSNPGLVHCSWVIVRENASEIVSSSTIKLCASNWTKLNEVGQNSCRCCFFHIFHSLDSWSTELHRPGIEFCRHLKNHQHPLHQHFCRLHWIFSCRFLTCPGIVANLLESSPFFAVFQGIRTSHPLI
jgi:hypothetical protein